MEIIFYFNDTSFKKKIWRDLSTTQELTTPAPSSKFTKKDYITLQINICYCNGARLKLIFFLNFFILSQKTVKIYLIKKFK